MTGYEAMRITTVKFLSLLLLKGNVFTQVL